MSESDRPEDRPTFTITLRVEPTEGHVTPMDRIRKLLKMAKLFRLKCLEVREVD